MIRWRCRRYRSKLSLLPGGDLSEREREAIAEHLANCAACRVEAESFERSYQLAIESAPDPVESASLWPALRGRLHREPPIREPAAGWLPATALAAATLVVGLAIWSNGLRTGSEPLPDQLWLPKDVPGITRADSQRSRSFVGWEQGQATLRPSIHRNPTPVTADHKWGRSAEDRLPGFLFEPHPFSDDRLESQVRELEKRLDDLKAELETRRRAR